MENNSCEEAKVLLLIQNAYTAFCYFHIPHEAIVNFDKRFGKGMYNVAKPCLKVFKVINNNKHEIQSINIDPFTDNWYISLNAEDSDIYVELVRYTENNMSYTLGTSNIVTTPRRTFSKDLTTSYIDVTKI